MANRWGNSDNFLGLQNHCGGVYSHEIKRCSLLGRKAVTNLDSVFKSRDIILLTKVRIVEAMIFPVVMYRCELDHKESWVLKNWCFWTMVLEKTLESPLDCKEIKSVNSKGNQPWIFIERTDAEAGVPILWPPDEKNWLIRKTLMLVKIEREGDERWWRTRKPGMLQFVGFQRVGTDWATEWWWSHFRCVWLYVIMDHSLPGSSVHRILQTRILEWVACSPPGDLPILGI